MNHLLLFIIGTISGSFILCTCQRFLNHKDFIFSRSQCDACKRNLKPYELIPILSYVLFKGKCPACGYRIPLVYPLFELFCGCSFMFLLREQYLINGILLSLLLMIVVIDYKAYIIPDFIVFLLAVNWLCKTLMLKNSILFGFTGSFLITSAIYLLGIAMKAIKGSKQMGDGDIKLLFVLGLFIDPQRQLLMILGSCVFGLIYMLISKRRMIAFGPWICLSFMLVYFVQ